jgi:hypothetical protein
MYIPAIKWATLCAVCTYIITTTITMGGTLTNQSPMTYTTALLLTLITPPGTLALKKGSKFSTLFNAPMVNKDISQRTKFTKSPDILFTKNT